jgi:hypothetical protein
VRTTHCRTRSVLRDRRHEWATFPEWCTYPRQCRTSIAPVTESTVGVAEETSSGRRFSTDGWPVAATVDGAPTRHPTSRDPPVLPLAGVTRRSSRQRLRHPLRAVRTRRRPDDILLAVNGEVSPSALGVVSAIAPSKTVRGPPIRPTGANPPACAGCLGSCVVREPLSRCGGLRVPKDAVSPCTVHPRCPRGGQGMPPDADFSASGHGPCHRPASPFCHGGDAQSREARVFDAYLSAGASVDVSPVEGVLSTTPTGGTPNHLQFSALSYRRDDPGHHNTVVRDGSGRIHARPEGRDSLLESGSLRRRKRPAGAPPKPPASASRRPMTRRSLGEEGIPTDDVDDTPHTHRPGAHRRRAAATGPT